MIIGQSSILFRKMLLRTIGSARNAALLGAGRYGRIVYGILKDQGVVTTVFDSRSERIDNSFFGGEIYDSGLITSTGYDIYVLAIERKESIEEINQILFLKQVDFNKVITLYDIIESAQIDVSSISPNNQMVYGDLLLLREATSGTKQKEYFLLCDRVKEFQNGYICRKYEKKSLNIAFVLEYSSFFAFENVYRMLKVDESINVFCIVPYIVEKNNKSRHEDCVKYLIDKDIDYIELDNDIDACLPDEFYPDILFFQRFYMGSSIEKCLWVENIKVHCALCYVPYSFWTTVYCDETMCSEYTYVTRLIFAPSLYHKNYYEQFLGEKDNFSRVVFSGYPKTDHFIDDRIGTSDRKRVIYAVGLPQPVPGSDYFESNLYDIYGLAKKYEDVEWTIRMHPLSESLWDHYSEFDSKDDYELFLTEWESLPNAHIDNSDEYYETFLESDAMITDSISFMAVYQYTHKPIFIISREGWEFNSFGKGILNTSYIPKGDLYDDIDGFVKEVVIEDNDTLKKERESFFESNLDYVGINNGRLASEYIVECIYEMINAKS